jgi:hypothetical protein
MKVAGGTPPRDKAGAAEAHPGRLAGVGSLGQACDERFFLELPCPVTDPLFEMARRQLLVQELGLDSVAAAQKRLPWWRDRRRFSKPRDGPAARHMLLDR